MTIQQFNDETVTHAMPGLQHGVVRTLLSRLDPHWILLAMLPWLMLLVRPNWIYLSVPGTIDPWVYHGFGLHLQLYLSKLFPATYYGTRLSVILPIWLCYKLFSPYWANLLLHVGWYYAAVFALYYTLRAVTSRRSALLTCILGGTYPLLIHALGWDYVDGPGIALFLVALGFATASRQGGRRGWWMIPAGAAALATLVTNFVWAAFIPIVLAYGVFLRMQAKGGWRIGEGLGVFLGFSVGFVGMFALFGWANYCINGNFWFIGPTIEFMRSQAGKSNEWVSVNGWAWLATATWLYLPMAALIAAICLFIPSRWARSGGFSFAARFWAGALIYMCIVFVLLQLKGQPFLYISYYASYLIPASLLTIGTVLLDQRWSRRGFAPFLTAVLILCMLMNLQRHSILYMAGYSSAWIVAAGLICVALRLICPWRAVTAVATSALFLFVSVTTLAMPLFPDSHYQGRRFYNRLSQADHLVWKNTQDQLPRFWYDVADAHNLEYAAIASVYLYGYNLVNGEFPSTEGGRLQAGQFIVVLSQRDDSQQRMNRAVAPLSLTPTMVLHEYIQSGEIGYWLDMAQLTAAPVAKDARKTDATP